MPSHFFMIDVIEKLEPSDDPAGYAFYLSPELKNVLFNTVLDLFDSEGALADFQAAFELSNEDFETLSTPIYAFQKRNGLAFAPKSGDFIEDMGAPAFVPDGGADRFANRVYVDCEIASRIYPLGSDYESYVESRVRRAVNKFLFNGVWYNLHTLYGAGYAEAPSGALSAGAGNFGVDFRLTGTGGRRLRLANSSQGVPFDGAFSYSIVAVVNSHGARLDSTHSMTLAKEAGDNPYLYLRWSLPRGLSVSVSAVIYTREPMPSYLYNADGDTLTPCIYDDESETVETL